MLRETPKLYLKLPIQNALLQSINLVFHQGPVAGQNSKLIVP